jgi:predicted outer membrane protein
MPGMSGYTATQWGPLSPADRDLIVKVRLACLWEMSTGQQMDQQGTTPSVKEAGRKISAEHTVLDQATRDIADKLGVPLPASPNAQQVAWMKEISSKTGSDYDRTAVQRLREAHGIVLPILSEVRISTRNELVRAFATEGALYVNRHISYLEDTGLVDYAALPEPQSPGLLSGSAHWTDLVVPGLVLIASLLVAMLIGSNLRGRKTGRAGKATLPPMVTASAPRVATAAALIALPEAASTARTVASTPPSPQPPQSPPAGFPPVTSYGTPPGGIPDVPTPMHGIPRARVTDSGRHAVQR